MNDWRLGPVLRRLAAAGRDVVFPLQCACCGVPQRIAHQTPGRLCGDCVQELAPELAHRCQRCSAPVGPHLETSAGCIHCRDEKWAFDRVVSLGVYDGPLRSAVLRMKHRGGEPMTAALVQLLVERHSAELERAPIDVLVPTPHHWTNRLSQAHLPPQTCARFLAAALKRPMAHNIVRKVRRTPPQSQLNATARRRNLTGAFRPAGRPKLAGLSVLIVDDVLTTGQTAHRVALALRDAGAAAVSVAVIARAVGAT